MFLQILRTLERLSTEVAFMRLQWDMDPDMRRDVVTFHRRSSAAIPTTGEVEIVCRLSPDMALTNMVLK